MTFESLVADMPPSYAGSSPPAPFENDTGGSTTGAGSFAFLLIIGLILASVALFWAMNRSLRTARRNLGGEQLPRPRRRRPRPTIPPREDGSHQGRDEGGATETSRPPE